MCFSAQASFTAAGVLAAIGVATFAQKPERKRVAFAAFPLFFAIHQAIEGFIWLSMESGGPPTSLAELYLFFAQVFWPVFTPLSVLLMEDDWRRKMGLWILFAAGAVVSAACNPIICNPSSSNEATKA